MTIHRLKSKITAEYVREVCCLLDCDPVEIMAQIALDITVHPAVRLKAAESLIDYQFDREAGEVKQRAPYLINMSGNGNIIEHKE